ncbi:MAG: M20/M25/M40 family metallo-hydrolase [Anaeromyxobacteraceae bacterium]
MTKTLAAVAALVLAGCAHPRAAAPASPAPAEPAIDAARARAEVTWLADPARTGRGTGTPGNPAAAAWIEERLREAGLAPAFPGGYTQPLEAPYQASLRPGNALSVGARALALGEGFVPFGFSDDGTVRGELVWAGYGITAPELAYDDYAGLDVKGKIVLVAQDFPREEDAASPFRDPRNYRYGEWRHKAANARDHGAAGVVMVRDGWNHAGADTLPPWKGQVASRAGIVAARATAQALAAADVNVAALAAPGQVDGKPHSRALGVPASISAAIEHEHATTANVAALLPGADPAVAGECVVVGAHYDHLGLGGETSLAPDRLGQVHPGADDNASGVAAMLAVARALFAGPAPRRTVLFVAFAAEEIGLLGSAELVRAPPPACPVERMSLMVNLDMVGRLRARRLYVDGADTGKGLRDVVKAAAAGPSALPLDLAFGGDGNGPSDHTSFHARRVPVLYLFTGAHGDYHRPGDTADKVDEGGIATIARLTARTVAAVAALPARLEVVMSAGGPPSQARGGERGYGAYLGTIPDFGERKAPGVLVSGVKPGSPAEKAGIAGGDVLLRIGARKMASLHDLVDALRAGRPGDVVEVELQRAGETKVVKVTLEEAEVAAVRWPRRDLSPRSAAPGGVRGRQGGRRVPAAVVRPAALLARDLARRPEGAGRGRGGRARDRAGRHGRGGAPRLEPAPEHPRRRAHRPDHPARGVRADAAAARAAVGPGRQPRPPHRRADRARRAPRAVGRPRRRVDGEGRPGAIARRALDRAPPPRLRGDAPVAAPRGDALPRRARARRRDARRRARAAGRPAAAAGRPLGVLRGDGGRLARGADRPRPGVARRRARPRRPAPRPPRGGALARRARGRPRRRGGRRPHRLRLRAPRRDPGRRRPRRGARGRRRSRRRGGARPAGRRRRPGGGARRRAGGGRGAAA